MNLRFEFLPYRRKFRQPLVTAHGEWRYREGIILRLEDADDAVGFGEIAPVPWFGTETFERALAWCKGQGSSCSGAASVSPELPCCGFALSSALDQLRAELVSRSFPVAGLFATDAALEEKQAGGFSIFKTKIGVRAFKNEAPRIEAWISRLRPGQRLRLDANGGLSERGFSSWLEFLEGHPIDFLEQPLGPGLENRMLEMAEPFSTPVALDESVIGANSLSGWSNWPGPIVVKPSLLGRPPKSLPFSALGSSVFETAFGFEASLQFLARHQQADTALGFDTSALLESDGWNLHETGPRIGSGNVTVDQLQELWEAKS